MVPQTNDSPPPDRATATPDTRVLRDTGGASYSMEMSVDGWVAMRGHPRQRDTARHSKKSHWKLVKKLTGAAAEAQRQVVAADLNGELYKVDGHTRGYLWSTGYLKRPESVLATVYRCNTHRELIRLYSIFDSQDAVEKQQDRVTGAMRQYGLILESKRLFQGAFTDALSIAWRGVARGKDAFGQYYDEFDVHEAVRLFKGELESIDSVDPQGDVFHTGVIAAALIDLTLDPRSLAFYARVAKRNVKHKEGSTFDPVEGVQCLMQNIKAAGTARDKETQEGICGRVLLASHIFRNGPSDTMYHSDGKFDNAPDILEAVKKVRDLKLKEAPAS